MKKHQSINRENTNLPRGKWNQAVPNHMAWTQAKYLVDGFCHKPRYLEAHPQEWQDVNERPSMLWAWSKKMGRYFRYCHIWPQLPLILSATAQMDQLVAKLPCCTVWMEVRAGTEDLRSGAQGTAHKECTFIRFLLLCNSKVAVSCDSKLSRAS